MIHDCINKGILKFHEKKEVMLFEEDPFPPIATVNSINVDLKTLLNLKKTIRRSIGYTGLTFWQI